MGYKIAEDKKWITSAPSLVSACGIAREIARSRPGVEVQVEDDDQDVVARYKLKGSTLAAWVR